MSLPGLNFQLGEDIDALRDAVRAFAAVEIAPRAAEIDQGEMPCCGEQQILGLEIAVQIIRRVQCGVTIGARCGTSEV